MEIAVACEASVDTTLIEAHWDQLVHLARLVDRVTPARVTALARFVGLRQRDPTTTPVGGLLLSVQ